MGEEAPLQPEPAREQVSPVASESSDDQISEDLDATPSLRESSLFSEDYGRLNASMQIFYQDLTMQEAYRAADQTRQQLKLYIKEIHNLQIDIGTHYEALCRQEFYLERVSPVEYHPPE